MQIIDTLRRVDVMITAYVAADRPSVVSQNGGILRARTAVRP
jgi:hypothetical protein